MTNSTKPKVLLYAGFKDKTVFYFSLSPPLGLFRLKHYLEKRGMECDVHDLTLHDGDFGDTKEKIAKGYYDVIGVSVDSEVKGRYYQLMREVRALCDAAGKRALIVCGGQGGAHAYKNFIEEGKADAVMLGFAEENFYKLIKKFAESNDSKLNSDKHISVYSKGVIGLAYPVDESFQKIQKIPTMPLTDEEFVRLNYTEIKDLSIPFQDYWEHNAKEGAAALNLKKDKVNEHESDPHCEQPNQNTQKYFIETVRLYTSSHCPWKCGFCSSHSFLRMSNASEKEENKMPEKPLNGKTVPMNSLATTGPQPHPVYRITPHQIYDLIKIHNDKYSPKVVLFNDDAFWDGSKPGFEHIMNLCDLIIDGKANGEINEDIIFNCQTKVGDFIIKKDGKRVLHVELLKKLRKAGFYHFGTGVETFAERLLTVQSINKKGNISEADQHMVIQGLLDHGFSPSVNIILFVPEQTLEELFHTMKVSTEYMLQGTQIALAPLLRPQAGAGIMELIDKGLTDVKAKYIEWTDPDTNKVFQHPLYCIPNNEKIAAFVEHYKIQEYDDMIKISEAEQNRIVEDCGWTSKVIPRTVTALSVFISISKFMKNKEWEDYFRDAVYEILSRNTGQNPNMKKDSNLIETTIMSNT